MKGFAILVVFIAIVAVAGGAVYNSFYKRVDPGDIGLMVHYDTGQVESLPNPGWYWVPRYAALLTYSGKEQTYIQDDNPAEGAMKGPDAVECRTKDTQVLRIDVATNWRPDPAKLMDLYRLRQGVPLTGPLNRDAPGAYIEDLIVRPEVRSQVVSACSHFNWEEIIGSARDNFASEIEKGSTAAIAQQGLIVRSVVIRQARPSDALNAVMGARLEGQKQREASDFAAAQAQRQAEINLTNAKAKADTDLVNTNAKAAQDIATADAGNKIKLQNADAQASETLKIGTAQAEANKALAASITPQFVENTKWSKWNGQLPQTTYGNDPSLQVQAK